MLGVTGAFFYVHNYYNFACFVLVVVVTKMANVN